MVIEGGGSDAAGTEAEISLQPMVKTVVEQVVFLQATEDPMLEQAEVQRKLWPHGKPALEQASDKHVDPCREELTLEQVC